jgi:hypothetical protein
MRSIKPLHFLLLAFLLAAGAGATTSAASHKLSSSVAHENAKGQLDPVDLYANPGSPYTSGTLSYQGENLYSGFDLGAAVIVAKPDYSNTYIRGRDGSQTLLSESYPEALEQSARLSVGWTRKSHFISLQGESTLSRAPYSTQSLQLRLRESFANKTTFIGATGTLVNQSQPESFFINRDFKTKARPTVVHGNEVTASVEQILTSRWKAHLELSTSKREEERPRNFGGRLKQGFAITSRIYSQLELAMVDENQDEALKNERGYFTLQSGQVTLITEPVYDLLVSASYGLVREVEYDPNNGKKIQVGTDLYGLSLRYDFGKWDVNVGGTYGVTNTPRNLTSVSGGIGWKF